MDLASNLLYRPLFLTLAKICNCIISAAPGLSAGSDLIMDETSSKNSALNEGIPASLSSLISL